MPSSAIAVVPVRGGALPAGGAEVVAEAGGRALLVGDGAEVAAKELAGVAAASVLVWEAGVFAPGTWATALGPVLAGEQAVLLPGSPDGRDLAPRLAFALGRPLLAGAVRVVQRAKHHGHRVSLARWGGLAIEDAVIDEPFVATLQPGVRGVEPAHGAAEPAIQRLEPPVPTPAREAEVLEVLPPDVTTMDLAEAPRILGGGAGLDGPERFAQLTRVATALNASMGATRVITDRGWVSHQRQIGTTGVVVSPRLYLAFGISGAVQHTSGLGDPARIISVNTDPHCPMMAMADLAVVADANAVLDELEKRLGGTDG